MSESVGIVADLESSNTKESDSAPKENNEEKATKKQDDSGWSTKSLILLCILVSVLSNIIGIFSYDKFFAQKIVAVDIKGYIEEQRNLYLEGKLSPEQLNAKFDVLEAAVLKIPKHKAIIMGDAVVRNVEILKP